MCFCTMDIKDTQKKTHRNRVIFEEKKSKHPLLCPSLLGVPRLSGDCIGSTPFSSCTVGPAVWHGLDRSELSVGASGCKVVVSTSAVRAPWCRDIIRWELAERKGSGMAHEWFTTHDLVFGHGSHFSSFGFSNCPT